MAAQCARGKQLINEKNFEEAVVAFTAALKESPTSPVYIGLRAQAYQRNKQYTEALADANASVVYAHQRAKKELIIDAQVRRAVILYNMERYGDARAVLEVVGRMNKDVKEAATWSRMIEGKVATLGEDHESMRVTVKEIPDLDSEAATSGPATSSTVGAASASASASASTPAPAAQTPAEKIRHDWYQNNQNIYLTLLAKGVPQDKTQVDITERSMSISFPVAASNTTYDFSLDPLYGSVKPENCITRILPTKVEIILAKATPGQKWHALESNEPVSESVTESASSNDEPVARAVFTSSVSSGPAYPTSSKSGPKNWDKLGDDDEEEEGDATNNFFKKLYQGASPEAQRAMMKSYTESNGTSLSTNWEEVSKGKVETLPPDGMEAKPWSK